MNKLTGNFRLRGKAKYVFAMLKVLATTLPIEQDKYWWTVRAYTLAIDKDRQPAIPIKLRSN